MPRYDENPFDNVDPDRAAIWNMLVYRDIDAYLAVDWESVENDFVTDGFFGVDAGQSRDPDSWKPFFSSLTAYRDTWMGQAKETHRRADPDRARAALFTLTTLRSIEINDDFAIARKKFNGVLPNKDGSSDRLNWQTHYYCRKQDGNWKIQGFTGYMPYPLCPDTGGEAKQVPDAEQHVTAGPYSPVIRVAADRDLVVISGQAPINPAGEIVGITIEEQTHYTLSNCETQLEAAGVSLADVFKVNVYLKDIGEWARFNTVYTELMPQPFPVRTAIQATLPLDGFRVEIEMWAVSR